MNFDEALEDLAQAIRRAAQGADLPLEIACEELCERFGGPPPCCAGGLGGSQRYSRALPGSPAGTTPPAGAGS